MEGEEGEGRKRRERKKNGDRQFVTGNQGQKTTEVHCSSPGNLLNPTVSLFIYPLTENILSLAANLQSQTFFCKKIELHV